MSDENAGNDPARKGDTGPHDPWTQNDPADAQATDDIAFAADAGDGDDAETLRERQRLMQLEMMDNWIGDVVEEQRRSRRWKLFFRLVWLLLIIAGGLAVYALLSARPTTSMEGQPHLGVVEVEGAIAADAPANAERIIGGLNRAWQADNAQAVVLHINSPGGSPVQSQRVYAEVMRLRESGDKPIIAVIEDIGASGAYYIAAAADRVVASPASLVGSIGVIYSGFGFQQAMETLGVERRVMTAGENKAFLDPFQPLDDEVADFWQTVLDTTHQQFIADVRAGRGQRLSDDPELFSGLVWTGEQAIELGLVDRLANLEDVSRERVGSVRRKDYTPALNPLDRLTRRFTRTAARVLGLTASPSPMRLEPGH